MPATSPPKTTNQNHQDKLGADAWTTRLSLSPSYKKSKRPSP